MSWKKWISFVAKIAVPSYLTVPGQRRTINPVSRVVSCRLSTFIADVVTHTYTEAVGQNIVLLNVWVWLDIRTPANPQRLHFELFTGTTEPTNSADIIGWENILPIFERGAPTQWAFCAGTGAKSWEMSQPYIGAGRRFAVRAMPDANLVGCMSCSFRIQEG